ncbi:competence/damage-inducible protein A [candidate division KSB3 bacterium]|uniref:CinA-like protein n=1 Tax=candidate division KSB3 bacterium TaxID=2044937 RepID=A0A2G6KFA4_9BACT|nr:MAG: competence/damage-inducible protein A [candidate division KSB3 bacterium]
MNAEIVAIGTELLLGQIVDTNSVYMAEQLNRIGIGVIYKTIVGDNRERLRSVLSRALDRSDVVITSGGIGPTEDDLTREIAADVTERNLVFHQDLSDQIRQIFTDRNLPYKENNRRQAYIPEGAIPIENPQGTAPGYIIETERGILLSLPGVPREMKCLMQETVLPYLQQKLGRSQLITYRVLKLCGTGESHVDHLIGDLITAYENPTIGLLAHLGQIDIRITAKAETVEEAETLIADVDQKIRQRLPHRIFGIDDETQEGLIADLLQTKGYSLAIAETNTGGYLAQQLIAVPGIDSVFRGAIVAPTRDSLTRLLDVSPDLIDQHELLGMGMAKQIAHAVKQTCGADIGLGITGYRQSLEGKIADPAVPIYIALHHADSTLTAREYLTSGPPNTIQTRVKNMALELLRRKLLGIEHEFDD